MHIQSNYFHQQWQGNSKETERHFNKQSWNNWILAWKTMCIDHYLTLCVLSHFSSVCLFVTLWAVAWQPPLSMGFSRQEYWSGVSCPPPGDLPHPGTESVSLRSSALAGRFFTTSNTWEAHLILYIKLNSKGIRNVKTKTIKFLEEIIGWSLCELEVSKDFLDKIQKTWTIIEKVDKLDFIKIKIFPLQKTF